MGGKRSGGPYGKNEKPDPTLKGAKRQKANQGGSASKAATKRATASAAAAPKISKTSNVQAKQSVNDRSVTQKRPVTGTRSQGGMKRRKPASPALRKRSFQSNKGLNHQKPVNSPVVRTKRRQSQSPAASPSPVRGKKTLAVQPIQTTVLAPTAADAPAQNKAIVKKCGPRKPRYPPTVIVSRPWVSPKAASKDRPQLQAQTTQTSTSAWCKKPKSSRPRSQLRGPEVNAGTNTEEDPDNDAATRVGHEVLENIKTEQASSPGNGSKYMQIMIYDEDEVPPSPADHNPNPSVPATSADDILALAMAYAEIDSY